MDQFFDPKAREAGREAAFEAFPQARGRMTILFAPTFRGHGAKSATYPTELLDYAALHALCVEKDAVCIIRMHPFVREPLEIPEDMRDRIVDGSSSTIDVNDLLFAVDLLVTDYSSIVFEFSTQDRPMLFFAYDLEEYVASRDFYVDYRAFVPGRIVRTFDEMLDAIRRDDYEPEKLAAFRATHFDHLDGHATDRVIELILDGEAAARGDPRPAPRGPDLASSAPVSRSAGCCRSVAASCWRPPTTRVARQPRGHPRRAGAADPTIPVVVLAHRPAADLVAASQRCAQARSAGYHLATSRLFIVDDYFFPIYVVRDRDGGRPSSRPGTPAGRSRSSATACSTSRSGPTRRWSGGSRIHSNYDVCLVASASVARTTRRRSASRSSGSCPTSASRAPTSSSARSGSPGVVAELRDRYAPARRPARDPVCADVPR